MTYLVAAASTDGVMVDGHFGRAPFYDIFSVLDDGGYESIGQRDLSTVSLPHDLCGTCSEGGCGRAADDLGLETRIRAVADCRCVLCASCGPNARRMLERLGVAVFRVQLPITEAMAKIIPYYARTDTRNGPILAAHR